ncbi:MAG: D-alanyl-D-alanine carboxypeptidase DacB [Chlamydiae bacterium]|nr:D-alanyl-D-alanine carboxypeptidase DacB [Chlamydiota bacterium]
MRRALFSILVTVLVSAPINIYSNPAEPFIHSKAAIVMELDSKKIIFQKNAHKAYYPASITKLPAALYALKKGSKALSSIAIADRDTTGSITKKYSIENNYKYPPHWLVLGGTHIQIHVGEKISFNDLMYGMLLESANDASNIVAKHVSGSVSAFTKEMNEYLKNIGCKNTYFANPHGLHFPKHMTTAYDMALVACAAAKEPVLRQIMKTQRHRIPATNKKEARTIINRNKLLSKKSVYYYPYAIIGKTGFHNSSKNTLVAAAKKGDKTLVVVVLQCPNKNKKYEDAIKLFEHGFSSLK